MGVEPVQGVDGFCDLVAGAAAEAVRFTGETHESGFDLEEPERGVVLLGFGDGRAEVVFTGHEESGSLDVFHEGNYGTFHVVVRLVPGIAIEPVKGAERGKIRSEDPAVPVDDGVEAGGGHENGPCGRSSSRQDRKGG